MNKVQQRKKKLGSVSQQNERDYVEHKKIVQSYSESTIWSTF